MRQHKSKSAAIFNFPQPILFQISYKKATILNFVTLQSNFSDIFERILAQSGQPGMSSVHWGINTSEIPNNFDASHRNL